jgi:hypothetical protein
LKIVTETTSILRPSSSAILWPLLFPVLVFAGIELYLFEGNVFYAHGSSSYLLNVAVACGGLACIWELVALPICAFKLLRQPMLRTRANLLAISLGALYVVTSILVVSKLLE